VRALSEPAQAPTLPPATIQPPAPERMLAMAAEHGIEILVRQAFPPDATASLRGS
jgi:alkanesulfonate monooxygenase SsuD/methylene tetrahydromethanopterin reductase-like flavin-dependent oxidoreductase (luciferase family)